MIVEVLTPFKLSQKTMEGEKYVTASLLVLCITKLRKELTAMASAPEETTKKQLAQKMLADFEDRWGGPDAPLFTGTVARASGNRQVGIHPALIISGIGN